jgi:hypothetical protein
MSRRGKIARLPREIRDGLNRGLANGEPGHSLVRWLNGLPAVREVLERYFGGRAINEPNLCAWRKGGFAEEQLLDGIMHKASELAGDAKELADAADGKLTQNLSTVVAAHYAVALRGWDGQADDALKRKMRVLHRLTHDVTKLRGNDLKVERLKLQREIADFRQQLATPPSGAENEFQRYLEKIKVN